MPLFRVKVLIPKYEVYEIDAESAIAAADDYSDGKIVNEWEGDPQVMRAMEVSDG